VSKEITGTEETEIKLFMSETSCKKSRITGTMTLLVMDSSVILDLCTTWSYVINFTPGPFYPLGKSLTVPFE
jgi:hypothetical protein